MTRSHRVLHRMIWPVLAFIVAFGFALALGWRPPPEPAPAAQVEQPR